MMGKPVIAGLVSVELIIEKLAAGETTQQILEAVQLEEAIRQHWHCRQVLRSDVVDFRDKSMNFLADEVQIKLL